MKLAATIKKRHVNEVDEYLGSLNSDETRRTYDFKLRNFFKYCDLEYDDFLLLAKSESENAQRLVVRYLKYLKNKRKLSGSSIETSRNAISGLVSSTGISELDFGIVSKKVGIIRNKKGKGRIPTKEEIRKLLDVCDLRSKALILTLCSSGIKIGALHNLKWKDVAPVTLGSYSFAKIRAYRNQNIEYTSFITPEAWQVLSEYRKEKEVSEGAGIGRESYVISKIRSNSPDKEKEESDALSIKYLERHIGTKWKSVGLRGGNETGNANVIRHEFKVFLGLRKFFETWCIASGMDEKTVEILLGRRGNLRADNQRPSDGKLAEMYFDAVPSLTIMSHN